MRQITWPGYKRGSAWYVLNTNPRCEDLVYRQLINLRVEVFLPKIGAMAGTIAPLFPGYLFIRTDLSAARAERIKFMHGVRRYLNMDGRPAEVIPRIIEIIRDRCDARGVYRRQSDFSPGDRVALNGGLLAGVEGVFTGEIDGSDRAKILIDAIHMSSKVEIPLRDLAKLS